MTSRVRKPLNLPALRELISKKASIYFIIITLIITVPSLTLFPIGMLPFTLKRHADSALGLNYNTD